MDLGRHFLSLKNVSFVEIGLSKRSTQNTKGTLLVSCIIMINFKPYNSYNKCAPIKIDKECARVCMYMCIYKVQGYILFA